MAQRFLTKQDRERIREGWERGDSTMEIAYSVGISLTTLYAELRRGTADEYYPGTDRLIYDPERAEAVFHENIKKRGNRTPREKARAT